MDIAIWQYGLNASWVLLPLVPAVIIYLIFPKTKVSLSGPFQGLSVRSSGAFAAYLIVLAATYPLLNEQNRNISGLYRPSWTIKGTVRVQDENGREINYDRQGGTTLKVSLRPDNVTMTDQRTFRAIVPEIDGGVPVILLQYEGYGTHAVDPSNPRAGQHVRVDPVRRHINITSPLVIRRELCRGMGC